MKYPRNFADFICKFWVESSGAGIPAVGFKKKISSPEVRKIFWSPLNLLQNGHQEFFPGLKRPAREVDHSIPSRVEVKNDWRCTFNPPIHLHAKEGGNYTFYLYIKPVNTLNCPSPTNLTFRQWIRQTAATEHHIPMGKLLLLMGQVQILNIYLETERRGFPLSS